MADATPAYVAFCRTCDGMVAVTVDDGKDPKGVSKFLAPIIRRGDRVERKTVGFVHAFDGEWCKCNPRRRKADAEQVEAAL